MITIGGKPFGSRKAVFGRLLGRYAILGEDTRAEVMSLLENEKHMKGLDLNTALTDIDSPASWAALIRDDYEMFELMLKRGARLDLNWTFTSRNGMTATTPQAVVCLCHDKRFFELLLQSGFSLNDPIPPLRGEDGRTKQLPLQLLFETYAQLEAKNDKSIEKLEASITYLIRSGADVNKDNPDGESAIMTIVKLDSPKLYRAIPTELIDKQSKHAPKEEARSLTYGEYLKAHREKIKPENYTRHAEVLE